LQKAQILAAKAEKEKPRKRPKRYSGKSERTQRRHRKRQEDLAKQGQRSVFDFMAHVKNNAKKKARLEQLVTRTLECEEVPDSEESAPGSEDLDSESDAEAMPVVPERVGQVRRKEILMD
jgi:hypothetical protein